MTINGEEVELVTSVDELRTGMIAWVKPCRACRRNDRVILLNPCVSEDGEPSFFATPICHPRFNCVGELTVRERRLYRVINPIDAATTARKREAVRT